MSLPGKSSPSRSRRAEGAGRTSLVLLLGLTLTSLAAAGGVLRLRSGRAASPGLLVSVAKGGGSTAMGMGVPERSYIAAAHGGMALENLTRDFHSASAPSVSYDGRRFLFAGRQAPSEAPAIWERGIDGARLRKVTEGNGDPGSPAYMPDGRILCSDLPAAGAQSEARSLFSCAPDGSAFHRLTFGDQQDLAPRVLPDGRIAFRRLVLAPSKAGAPMEMVIHPDGTGLARLPQAADAGTPPADLARVKAPKGDYVMTAVPAAPRSLPPVLTSVIRPEWNTGTLLCLNVAESRIPEVAALAPGSIRRVRLTTKNVAGEQLSGEAPVMADGSFFVEVPADTPLQIHLLGEDGSVLASFASGIWVRPNENHGCIGCHEEPDLSPANRQPLAVQRPPTSLLLALTRKGGSGGR
jgi:hydrazine synthase alpha subunit-like protein